MRVEDTRIHKHTHTDTHTRKKKHTQKKHRRGLALARTRVCRGILSVSLQPVTQYPLHFESRSVTGRTRVHASPTDEFLVSPAWL